MKSQQKKYTEKEYIVAFIDVLGAKEAIAHNSEDTLNLIHDAYETVLNKYQEIRRANPHSVYIQGLKYKIFSDNIIIAFPRWKNKRKLIYALSLFSALLQIAFLKRKMLTRGGIAIGLFFCDDIMVWGDALVKAYKIESIYAKYPRIVFDKVLIDDLRRRYYYGMIKNDTADGEYYVHYLNPLSNVESVDYNELIDIRNYFEKQRENYEKNNKMIGNSDEKTIKSILEKLEWYISYSLENEDNHIKRI